MGTNVKYQYSEESLDLAIQEIGDGAKIRETARKYGIPHSTIINKIKSRTPLIRNMGPPTILTTEEENLLVLNVRKYPKILKLSSYFNRKPLSLYLK